MIRPETAQRLALWTAAVTGLLGLMTSTGCGLLPQGDPSWAWAVHPVLFGLGVVFGLVNDRRQRQIDAEREETLRDTELTKGEIRYAHKRAQDERRRSGVAFTAAPLFVAGWLSYQLGAGRPGTGPQDLLPLSALAGFGVGVLVAALRRRGGS